MTLDYCNNLRTFSKGNIYRYFVALPIIAIAIISTHFVELEMLEKEQKFLLER